MPLQLGVEMDDLPMETIDDTFNPKTFFFEQDLNIGKTMNVQFSKQPFAQPYAILYSLSEIKDMDKEGYTSDELCAKNKAHKGEHKYCAKSLRTLMCFAISQLGKNIQALSSSFISKHEQILHYGGSATSWR